MWLNRHFREFIALLEKHAVKYLVAGGHARWTNLCFVVPLNLFFLHVPSAAERAVELNRVQ